MFAQEPAQDSQTSHPFNWILLADRCGGAKSFEASIFDISYVATSWYANYRRLCEKEGQAVEWLMENKQTTCKLDKRHRAMFPEQTTRELFYHLHVEKFEKLDRKLNEVGAFKLYAIN